MAENLPHHTPAAVGMAATDWEGELPSRLAGAVPGLYFRTYLGQNWIETSFNAVPGLLLHLRDHEQFDGLTDLTAVDRPSDAERFEIVYILYSFPRNERIRVKTRAAAGQEIPTVVPIFAGANWLEREVFDMFGIRFAGHPGLKRILMPDDWTGHPLRKDKAITAMDNEWVQRNLDIESGQ